MQLTVALGLKKFRSARKMRRGEPNRERPLKTADLAADDVNIDKVQIVNHSELTSLDSSFTGQNRQQTSDENKQVEDDSDCLVELKHAEIIRF